MEKKPIGIIGAMAVEIEAILEAAEITAVEEHASMLFHVGTLSGVPIVAAKCHAGKVNSALCAQVLIDNYAPRAMLNIGVAGGIGPNVHIGDVVIAASCVQYDYDTTGIGEPPAQLELPAGKESRFCRNFPCDRGVSEKLAAAAEREYDGSVHVGTVATGDRFVADPDFGEWLHSMFGALACEMEGGSIVHACLVNGVPCAVLRSISDNANDDAHTDFPTFAADSARKAQRLLKEVIAEL